MQYRVPYWNFVVHVEEILFFLQRRTRRGGKSLFMRYLRPGKPFATRRKMKKSPLFITIITRFSIGKGR